MMSAKVCRAVAMGAGLWLALAAPVTAEDFTYRRIAVPKAGAKRITVQIAPGALHRPSAPRAA
ncbi:lytic transglycosylase domain-containing protein, partial [Limimaricola sp. ASW11-118]|nr:lytic transglycosylase domain-containing protein [Limimaricola litoreus]